MLDRARVERIAKMPVTGQGAPLIVYSHLPSGTIRAVTYHHWRNMSESERAAAVESDAQAVLAQMGGRGV